MIIHCSQDSFLTSAPSPLSTAEVFLSFPQSRHLWFARTATGWKEAFFTSQVSDSDHHVSMIDCLADLTCLRHLPSLYDANIAYITVLHGIASMVQSYRRLKIASLGTVEGMPLKPRESVLPDDSQYLWLLKVFESLHQTFRLCESNAETSFSIMLLFELLLLHFHCSIDQMELLAGKEGFEEAQASYSILQRWIDNGEARQAVWRAGQILKLVRALPPETMNDFHCVALYHGSLCLWAYGIITTRRHGRLPTEAHQPRVQDIILDGEESLETQRWIAFDRGRPVISTAVSGGEPDRPPVISIQSTDAVMQTCIQATRSKYPSRAVLPPSTEQLCYLMHALSMTMQRTAN